MKRLLLWLFVSALAVLWGSPALGGTASGLALRPLPASELATVTGGRCIGKCPEEPSGPEPVYWIGTEWRKVKQVDNPVEQLAYAIVTELSNVSGVKPKNYSYTLSDGCRYRWTSGGVGITSGFSVNIGTTYHCPKTVNISGTLDPGWRLKLYKGEMRQYQTTTMALYDVFSDGTDEDTGRRDYGRKENLWTRYSPVEVFGN